MNKNLMPEVAELLGVELEESFAIKTGKGIFRARITTSGLHIGYDSIIQPDRNNLLCGLLQGLYTIQRPSVDAVKHGHWEESKCLDDCFWVCSCCKFPSQAVAAPKLYKYCPNCGARMDGKAE